MAVDIKCPLCKEDELDESPHFDEDIQLHVCKGCVEHLKNAEDVLKDAKLLNCKK